MRSEPQGFKPWSSQTIELNLYSSLLSLALSLIRARSDEMRKTSSPEFKFLLLNQLMYQQQQIINIGACSLPGHVTYPHVERRCADADVTHVIQIECPQQTPRLLHSRHVWLADVKGLHAPLHALLPGFADLVLHSLPILSGSKHQTPYSCNADLSWSSSLTIH